MSGDDALVLIVEDDAEMRRFLRAALRSQGYRYLETASGEDALELSMRHAPDLVLLDLGLPDGDGVAIARRLRECRPTPILVISARARESDKVKGLDAGADDYLTKPFGRSELLARIRAALRRTRISVKSTALCFDGLRIDFGERQVTRDGAPLYLTKIEYRLLALLARNAGKVLTHQQILREVWGAQTDKEAHHVRVHMGVLRKKIETDPAQPKLLLTEQGVGYRFVADVSV